ncbi:hypothetical protein OV203_01810 [Nannocystis sp. ILAH1]|uniref:hypothetical protein n=1 Tax=unclassified Nannocystis TaxID=2627009 RepID=UPI00226FCF9F|nr:MULTISPECIES: hypothetical protein [unclassified Nannocystis]MCY0985847.1 hypothetical protein [Nannocystis sp. ILAH1]MCY1068482.1 hypothetical protein [Nannocystis sp. RBIL2]
MWPLVFAGLFLVWNLQTSLRIAYSGAVWLGGGGYPVFSHVVGNLALLGVVTGVAFVRADALRLATPWWLLAATVGLTVGHVAALVWLDRLGTTQRNRGMSAGIVRLERSETTRRERSRG